MAVGLPAKVSYVDGDVFSASDINDTNGTINLIGQTQNFYAGKNKIINGDFEIWQRGTSFTTSVYTADRWRLFLGNTLTASRQTFTAGTAPVAGYEGEYFYRMARTTSTSADYLAQFIEDVRTFAGQTVTLSFWAKADAACTLQTFYDQNFGSGGSTQVSTSAVDTAITTSWVRYTVTTTLGAMTGKTIGTSSYLSTVFVVPAAAGNRTVDLWGVQLESGSTATAFQTATGTIQGELAACQRYFYRAVNGADNTEEFFSVGQAYSTSATVQILRNPVTMRANPTLTVSSGSHFAVLTSTYSTVSTTGVSADKYSPRQSSILMTGASGLTAGNASGARANSASATLDLSAEL
jgi:hypothetical protein